MKIKEAVEHASRQLPEVFPIAAERELRLEGIEKTEDGKFWKVTFSYPESAKILGKYAARDYKTVKLRDSDGEFVGAQNGMMLESL